MSGPLSPGPLRPFNFVVSAAIFDPVAPGNQEAWVTVEHPDLERVEEGFEEGNTSEDDGDIDVDDSDEGGVKDVGGGIGRVGGGGDVDEAEDGERNDTEQELAEGLIVRESDKGRDLVGKRLEAYRIRSVNAIMITALLPMGSCRS